jgi:O-methyltransferase
MKTIADYKPILDKAGQAVFGFRPTLDFTAEATLAVLRENIPGALVECGVAAGAHPAVMARIALDHPPVRQVHLFDSFCGIPKGGPEDKADITALVGVAEEGEGIVTSGATAFSLEQVKHNLRTWGIPLTTSTIASFVGCPGYRAFHDPPLIFHEGWFQSTIPLARCYIENIALLRLDGDLYESTKVCMEHLYPLVSPGGYVIIDDWALAGCRKAVCEVMGWADEPESHRRCGVNPIEGGHGPAWWRKP